MTRTAERTPLASLEFEDYEEEGYEPLVGLRVIKEGLQRHRSFWLACAVLGLLVGACFHLVVPAKYVAVTDLYLTEPTSTATYTTADDASLAETNTVAYGALKLVHLPANLLDEPGKYVVTALSDVLLQIKGDGPTRSKAVQWTSALARSFLAVRERALNGQMQLVVNALRAQASTLTAQVDRLSGAIAALDSAKASLSNSNEVANLVSERSTDESQLTTLQAQIQQDLLEQSAVNKGSYVLDPAQTLRISMKRVFAEDGLSGLVAGLAVGIGGVVVSSVISEKPRRRDEVAQLLGAPVELSMRGPKDPGPLRWSVFRSWVKKPDAELQSANRRLRHQLLRLPQHALAVVTVGGAVNDMAAVLVGGVAYSLATEGKKVLLVDMAPGRPLARLFRQRRKGQRLRAVKFGAATFDLAIAPDDPGGLDHDRTATEADCVLVLATADPAMGTGHLRPWVSGSVVVLRSGKATATLIHAAGEMLRDGGTSPLSAIEFGAGREDESFGAVSAQDALGAQASQDKNGANTLWPRVPRVVG